MKKQKQSGKREYARPTGNGPTLERISERNRKQETVCGMKDTAGWWNARCQVQVEAGPTAIRMKNRARLVKWNEQSSRYR